MTRVFFSIQLLAAPSVEGGKKKKGSSLDKMLAESDRLDKKMTDAQRRQEEKRKKYVRTMIFLFIYQHTSCVKLIAFLPSPRTPSLNAGSTGVPSPSRRRGGPCYLETRASGWRPRRRRGSARRTQGIREARGSCRLFAVFF